MPYVVIWIAPVIEDFDIIAILGNRTKKDSTRLSEVDIIHEEIMNAVPIIESIWDKRPEPGLWLVECYFWYERDYYGEYDSGLEIGSICVKLQDGPDALMEFKTVLKPIEEKLFLYLNFYLDGRQMEFSSSQQKNAFFEDVIAWAEICKAMEWDLEKETLENEAYLETMKSSSFMKE